MLLSNVVAAFLAGLAGFRKVVSRKSSARTEIKGRAAAAHVPSGGGIFSVGGVGSAEERRGVSPRCVQAFVRLGVFAPGWDACARAWSLLTGMQRVPRKRMSLLWDSNPRPPAY